jgi:hypothetical protein
MAEEALAARWGSKRAYALSTRSFDDLSRQWGCQDILQTPGLPPVHRDRRQVARNWPAASRSLNVAFGIDSGGRREVLGMGIGAIRGRDLWISFLHKLARRSLSGVGMPAETRAAHYPLPQLPGPNRIVIQGTSRLRCRRSRDLGVAHLTNLTRPAHHLSVRLQGEPPAQRQE